MSSHGTSDFRTLFSQIVRSPEEDIELDRAALYLAGEEYPNIEVHLHLAELDALAGQISLRVSTEATPAELGRAIAGHLFGEAGFHGNSGRYYDPDNSYLNRVLTTRSGIPITLSLVFMEVGRRLGLRCHGVGLPGHFIVGIDDPEATGTGSPMTYLDPFNAGAILTAGDCRNVVQNMSGGRMEWSDGFLAPCTKLDILFRMLNNLKSIYMRSEQHGKAIGVIQRMGIISPGLPSLYQEQSWCHAEQHEYRRAIECLEDYLKTADGAQNAQRVKEQINGLWASLSRLN
ncbi:MAG: transglutaminase-like domain-containing protein [Chloroflexi bacterium]|nr:transglutaminase-like domain-containing protein [Chloroflexota bacterium]MDA1270600.1 transglutaminase-like domain-containing protein [Chloroflexota bacterium]